MTSIFDGSPVSKNEIEAAADALRILWESAENQQALRERGAGASWLHQAKIALEAALAVRERPVVPHDSLQ